MAEVKDKKNIVVNCLSGLRAKTAFSLMAGQGIESVVVADNFDRVKKLGF